MVPPANFAKSGYKRMKAYDPGSGPYCEWRNAILFSLILVTFCTVPARAQDAAEAARQQKAAKAAEQKAPQHVYTEDDLKRSVILTPEDRARVEARKKQQNTIPGEENAEQLPKNDLDTESLGEIARRYRLEKAAREAELAMKKKFTPFSYEVPINMLAAPAPPVAPLTAPALSIPLVEGARPRVPGLSPDSAPRAPHAHMRISPFQPRPVNGSSFAPPAALVFAPTSPEPPSVASPTEKPVIAHPLDHRVLHPSEKHLAPLEKNSVRPLEKNVAPVERFGPSRSVQPVAPLANAKRVQVQRGQSWWKLAEVYLGNGARWPELRRMNADAGGPPELLKLGSSVVVPGAAKANQAPEHTVKVRKGDSLWSLAHEYLGRGTAWICLANENPQIVNFTHLAIGTNVQLPTGDALKACQEESTKLEK